MILGLELFDLDGSNDKIVIRSDKNTREETTESEEKNNWSSYYEKF